MLTVEKLQEKLAEYQAASQAIRAKAEEDKRDLTSDEESDLVAAIDGFNQTHERLEQIKEMDRQSVLVTRGNGRKTQPEEPDGREENLGPDYAPAPRFGKRKAGDNVRVLSKPNWAGTGGFDSFGAFGKAVYEACLHNGNPGQQLAQCQQYLAAATIYGNEAVGSDGGFAVPPDFRTAIMEKVLGEESLLAKCDQITCSGNTFTAPFDETTPWQTTGGIQAYWDGEASTATQSKPLIEQRTVKLNKIRALVPMTEELLEDASAMDAYLRRKAPEKIAFKTDLAILQGTGVGQPAGIMTAGCTVSVAKVASQVADTLVGINIINMYARMYAPLRSQAVWVFHQDVEPQLWTLMKVGKIDTGANDTGWGSLLTHVISYGPDGSMRIFGRPVIFSQACETLGDKGDAFFIHFPSYLALLKSGPNPRTETSMHLWFDQDLVAFKFVLRVGGIPWWASSVAARDGSNTYSCFVTLDERG